MEIIQLRDDYIKLGQALKAAGLVESGVEAKMVIQDGLVLVNGHVEMQRGKKLTGRTKYVYFSSSSLMIQGAFAFTR